MGGKFMDYILADRHVIPEEEKLWYAEKVVWLPNCFQANDALRVISEPGPSRAELGLPEAGLVFCCLNNNYKINPEIFSIWMRLLHAMEGSVLWLLGEN
jgi:predicted O-linked N-acetylglucosamine transferase (SPINDLY family)